MQALVSYFVLAGLLVVSARQIVLLLLLNDFVTMSLATDRVATIPDTPQRWDLRVLVGHALLAATAWVLLSAAVIAVGSWTLDLDAPRLQTLAFVVLVFTGQATGRPEPPRRRWLLRLRPPRKMCYII